MRTPQRPPGGPTKYPEVLFQLGIKLAMESERTIARVAADLGFHPETLRKGCVSTN